MAKNRGTLNFVPVGMTSKANEPSGASTSLDVPGRTAASPRWPRWKSALTKIYSKSPPPSEKPSSRRESEKLESDDGVSITSEAQGCTKRTEALKRWRRAAAAAAAKKPPPALEVRFAPSKEATAQRAGRVWLERHMGSSSELSDGSVEENSPQHRNVHVLDLSEPPPSLEVRYSPIEDKRCPQQMARTWLDNAIKASSAHPYDAADLGMGSGALRHGVVVDRETETASLRSTNTSSSFTERDLKVDIT